MKRKRTNDSIPLHACSKEEIKVCAILSLGLNGPSYELFRAGHSARLSSLPAPDFIHGATLYQYDGKAFHKDTERDIRVTARHLAAGYTVVRLRDRVTHLPAAPGLTCVSVSARDSTCAAVYDLVGVARTPANVALVEAWSSRRLSELVDVPACRKPGLAWLQAKNPTPLLLKHYRLPFENGEFMHTLQTLCQALPEKACRSVLDRYDLEFDMQKLHVWLARLGAKRFVTFAGNNGVAARLTDPEFHAALEMWFGRLGVERFVTFAGNGGVAKRLTDLKVHAALEMWLERLGVDRFVTFAGNDSVATRLTDSDFHAALEMWLERLGVDRFVTFAGNGSVATRLTDPDFHAALEMWLERLGVDRFVTFAGKNCVATRLTDPDFHAALVQLLVFISLDSLASLNTNQFISRFWPRGGNTTFRARIFRWLATADSPNSLPTIVKRTLRLQGSRGLDTLFE